MDAGTTRRLKSHALNTIANFRNRASVSALVPTTVLVAGETRASLDFNDVIKKFVAAEYNVSMADMHADCVSITVAFLWWNSSNNQHECRGTVEVWRTPRQRSFQQTGTSGEPDNLVRTPQRLHLCTYMDGSNTNLTVDVTNLWPVDYDRVQKAQQQRRKAYTFVTSAEVKMPLTAYMVNTLGCDLNNGFSMIHWYMFAQCGTGIYSTMYGQPSLGSFVGTIDTIAEWWNVAVELSCVLHLRDSQAAWSWFMLDAVGCAALAVLVGPYTRVPDVFDSRNTKWATFNRNGDCDKDALTGGAVFTMLMRAMASAADRAALQQKLNKNAMAILDHWYKYRGEPVIMHVLAHPSTATGEAVDPNCTDPPMGHCVLGLLPKVYKIEANYYVQYVTPQLKPVLRRFDSNFENGQDEYNPLGLGLGLDGGAVVQVTLKQAVKMGAIVLGEMTVPSTPYSGVDHTNVAYTSVFRAFGSGPGTGGLLLFTPGHYAHGLQIYSQNQTVVVKPTASGVFPSVDAICATGAQTVTFDVAHITKLTRRPPVVLESIDQITHDSGGRNVTDKLKRLTREGHELRLMHKDALSSTSQVYQALVQAGAAEYAVGYVSNNVLQLATCCRGLASDLCRPLPVYSGA